MATPAGASGYLGTELTKQLLDRGYTVRSTVRAVSAQSTGHLEKLAEALPGKFEAYEADVLKPGSFDKALRGVTYVYASRDI